MNQDFPVCNEVVGIKQNRVKFVTEGRRAGLGELSLSFVRKRRVIGKQYILSIWISRRSQKKEPRCILLKGQAFADDSAVTWLCWPGLG